MPFLILGLTDPWVATAILLSILVTLVCGVYGYLGWNRDDNAAPDDETVTWAREEREIDEEL